MKTSWRSKAKKSTDARTLGVSEGIVSHLNAALKSAKAMEQRLDEILAENHELKQEIEQLKAKVSTSAKQKSKTKDSRKVVHLENQIALLQKEKSRQRAQIKELREREVAREAEDIQDSQYITAKSIEKHKAMKKILHRFGDLMHEPSLGEDEECGICLDKMVCKETSILPCEHLAHTKCFARIEPGSSTIACPHCRQRHDRDTLQLVEMTAQEQWEDLLELAVEWEKLDRGLVEGNEQNDNSESSSSEEEETLTIEDDARWINDGDDDESSLTSLSTAEGDNKPPNQDANGREPSQPEPATPPRLTRNPSLGPMTSAQKRKRMEELIQARNARPRVF